MTRYLAGTRTAILTDLASNGYEWKDEDGVPRIPEPFEQTSHNGHTAIYLGKVPVTDADGNVTYSTQFCANVTDPDSVFDTEIEAPTTPYNVFA
jgi:hypothetical protein